MTIFVCGECWRSPRQGCMYENHSTAFPDAKMRDLGCPRGLKPNWRFIDRPLLGKINAHVPTIGTIRNCYSQKDIEAGLTPAQFYEQQGRVYKNGDWEFPQSSTVKETEK